MGVVKAEREKFPKKWVQEALGGVIGNLVDWTSKRDFVPEMERGADQGIKEGLSWGTSCKHTMSM